MGFKTVFEDCDILVVGVAGWAEQARLTRHAIGGAT